jgi:hypothetical protein
VTSGWLSVLGFIIGRMVLARSVIERAVRQQLADLDLDSGDFEQSTPGLARSSSMNGAAKGWRNCGSVFT